MNQFDLVLYHLINNISERSPILDLIMIFFAKYAMELYVILFITAWFVLPKSNTKQRHSLIVSVCAGILALIINFAISHVWFRPRPFMVLPRGSFHQLIPHSADASFPSDHVAGGFAFASASWWAAGPKWLSHSFTVLAIIVMIARVYVGVHWPTDVLAGILVGILAGRAMWDVSPLLSPLTLIVLRFFGFEANQEELSSPSKKRKRRTQP